MDYRSYGSISMPIGDNSERIPLYPEITRTYAGAKILGMCRSSCYFSMYLCIYVMFLFSGATIFSIVEAPEENSLRIRVETVRQKFLTKYPSVPG